MAASEILGLFTSPQQYQQNQLAQFQNRAAQEVQLNPFQQAALGARTAGYQLGQGIGGALGGQDPQLQKIARRQQLLSQLDQSDPASYARVAKIASDAGDQELAFGIANAGREAAVKIAQANKERQLAVPARIQESQQAAVISQAIRQYKALPQTPETTQAIETLQVQLDFLSPKPKTEATPNEIQIATRFALRKGVEGTPEYNAEFDSQLTRLTTKEPKDISPNVKEVGVAEGTRAPVYLDVVKDEQFTYQKGSDGKQVRVPYVGGVDRTTAKVSATSTSKGADEGAKTIAELSAKRVDAARVSAGKAIEQAGLLQELLKTPQPISGSGAPVRVGALRVFSTFGLTSSKDDEALGNADKFNALAGERVISFIKALGSNPTDTDREFARTIGPALEKGTKTNADLINFLLERARKVVKDADAIEAHFYDNNYSLRGYKSPFLTDLETTKSKASDKPVSQMTKQELLEAIEAKKRQPQ
jgi:hypothetical protein